MAIGENGGQPWVIWDDGEGGKAEIEPSWTSDGRALAFVGRSVGPAGPYDNVLYVLREGDTEPSVVVRQELTSLRYPDWSPDGKRIAYVSGVNGVNGVNGFNPSVVRIIDLSTGLDRPVVALTTDQRFIDVVWSPRGDRLLATAVTRNFDYSIWSMRPDGDPHLTLVSDDRRGDPNYGYPAFVPGGAAVLVAKGEFADGEYLGSSLALADPSLRWSRSISQQLGEEEYADFGPSPRRAVYVQFTFEDPASSAVAILDLVTARSTTLVPAGDGLRRAYPDWQPVGRCGPWSSDTSGPPPATAT
jgi:dipeptidyl aminopeptidase/acylaminoacyl peptidase